MGKNPGLGIGLSVLGSLCTALGYTFQKLAHRRADASAEAAAREAARNAGPGADLAEGGPSSSASLPKPLPKGTPYYRFWQFPAGLAMLILGSIVGVVTFGLAGQAELAPMSAVTLVWNELLAWRVLRERFTRIDAISVALMAGGTTLALIFAVSTGTDYDTVDAVMALLDRPAVYAFCVIAAASMTAAAYLVSRWGRVKPAELPPLKAAGDAAGRAFVGGMLGGFTGFLVKALVEVISSSVGRGDWSVFARWQIYLLVPLLVLVLANQLRYMNSGLARWDSNRVIPIYQSTLVFSGVLCGYVLWDEVAVQTTQSLLLFGAGCVLTIAGVGVLGLKPPQAHGDGSSSGSSGAGSTTAASRSRGASLEMVPLTADASHEVHDDVIGIDDPDADPATATAAAGGRERVTARYSDNPDADDHDGEVDTRAIDVAAASSSRISISISSGRTSRVASDGHSRAGSVTSTAITPSGSAAAAESTVPAPVSTSSATAAALASARSSGGAGGRLSTRSTGSTGGGSNGLVGHMVDGVLAAVRPRPAPRTSKAGALIEALEVLAAAASGGAIDPELSSSTRDVSGAPARRAGPRFFAGDDDDDDDAVVAAEDGGDGYGDAGAAAEFDAGNGSRSDASGAMARGAHGPRAARPSSATSAVSAARGPYGGRGSRTLSRVDCPYGALESPPPAGRSARPSTVPMVGGLGGLGSLGSLSGLDDDHDHDDDDNDGRLARGRGPAAGAASVSGRAAVQAQPRPQVSPQTGPISTTSTIGASVARIPPLPPAAMPAATTTTAAAGGSASAFAAGGLVAFSARAAAPLLPPPRPAAVAVAGPGAPVPAPSPAGKRQSVSWSLGGAHAGSSSSS